MVWKKGQGWLWTDSVSIRLYADSYKSWVYFYGAWEGKKLFFRYDEPMDHFGGEMKEKLLYGEPRLLVHCVCLACLSSFRLRAGPKMEAGAVILAERIDPVVFRGADNQQIDDAQATVGSIVPEGASVETGPGGSALLLLSNGTVVTVTENAKMKIKSFDQEAFTSNGKSMKDFQEELSPSRVLVDLEVGSLVVQTKKLNKKSNLEFRSGRNGRHTGNRI